jgi:hypothetical protein
MSASAEFLGISLATVLATERISAVLSGASDVIFSAFASSRSARTRGGSCARFSVIEHPAKMATQLNKVNLINCQLNLSTPSLSIDMDASNTPNFASILNLRLVMLFQRSLSRASLGTAQPTGRYYTEGRRRVAGGYAWFRQRGPVGHSWQPS